MAKWLLCADSDCGVLAAVWPGASATESIERPPNGRQRQDHLQQAAYFWNGQARQLWICPPFSCDLLRMEASQA